MVGSISWVGYLLSASRCKALLRYERCCPLSPRNRNWELLRDLDRITMRAPTLFLELPDLRTVPLGVAGVAGL